MTSDNIGKEGYLEGLKLCYRKMEEVEYHLKYLTDQRDKNLEEWGYEAQDMIDMWSSRFLLKNIIDMLKIVKTNSPDLLYYHNSDKKFLNIPSIGGKND